MALAKFVTQSFPEIARNHNAFAKLMNEEIESNEHEGYSPVLFPIVPEPEAGFDEDVAIINKGKKRKRSASAAKTLTSPDATPQKKKKTEVAITRSAIEPATLPPASPAQIRDAQALPPQTESLVSSSAKHPEVDTVSSTPDSHRRTAVEQAKRPNTHTRVWRESCPSPDIPPSKVFSNEVDIGELDDHVQTAQEDTASKPLANTTHTTTEETEPGRMAPKSPSATSLPDALSSSTQHLELEQSAAANDDNPDGISSLPALAKDPKSNPSMPPHTPSFLTVLAPAPPTLFTPIATPSFTPFSSAPSAIPNTDLNPDTNHLSDPDLDPFFTFTPLTSAQAWEEGMRAIEMFEWDR